MAVEARRGCGFRKVGGLYLVSDGAGRPCGKLPLPLTVCPCCGAGIKQARGWTWVDAGRLFADTRCARAGEGECVAFCPLYKPERLGRVGLLWIGRRFYPTPEHFELEARAMGISRRIAALPQGFEVGSTWVLLAHGQACASDDGSLMPGVFRVFCPTRIEKLITQSQATDENLKALARKGITPVIVPDADRDHRGSVYEDVQPELRGLS